MLPKVPVYVGMGGNIGDTFSLLSQAIQALACLERIEQFTTSRLYLTSPVSHVNQRSFLNVVCSFQTDLNPKQLLHITQHIEVSLGKVPKPKEAPRPIDIDILFYGSHCYWDTELEIPHPRWKERLFVLVPLSDLISKIQVQSNQGCQCFILQDLIQEVNCHSNQVVSLVEKKLILH